MESANSSSKIQTLKSQIEYYFSDDNLQGDKFFYDKINDSTDVNKNIL